MRNIEMSIVTNGLLLDEFRIKRLHELGVSIAISIDGFTEEANSMRVDVVGNPVFFASWTSLIYAKVWA